MGHEILETVEISEELDIIDCRLHARKYAIKIGFGIVDQTRISTAVSEIARNTLKHGGGGWMKICEIKQKGGIKLKFVDNGPGIPDTEQALIDGYTTGDGLGLGLGGAKRLMDEFHIDSELGMGTTVILKKYLEP